MLQSGGQDLSAHVVENSPGQVGIAAADVAAMKAAMPRPPVATLGTD
jgi:hypothetical protein